MSDTPLYDETCDALLVDDPLAPARPAGPGRHRLRDDSPPEAVSIPSPRPPPLADEPALASLHDPLTTTEGDR